MVAGAGAILKRRALVGNRRDSLGQIIRTVGLLVEKGTWAVKTCRKRSEFMRKQEDIT